VTLNKREQTIAWILGAVVGLGVVYYAGLTWWDARAKLDDQIFKAQNTLKLNKAAMDKANRVEADLASWRIQRIDMNRPDPSQTDALIRNTYSNAGLGLSGWAGQGLRATTGSRDFQESKYTAAATTTTARLARFLQTIENAPLPARIDQITVTTPRQGIDNLHVEINISALLYAPKTATTTQSAKLGPEVTKPATTTGATTRGTTTRSTTTRRTTTTRGTTTRAATATKPALTPEQLSKLEQDMAERKRAEEARLATMPAPETKPKRTPEEIEAEMRAKRAVEEGRAPESQPATGPAPEAKAPKTPEEIEAELKAKRLAEQGAPAGSQPTTETSPATTGGTQ
jgi:hypothetical protein